MIRITPDQLAALSTEAHAGFVERVAVFLQEQLQETADVDPAELCAEIGQLVAKAQTYGLIGEREIVSYVIAAACFGDQFDAHRDVKTYLLSSQSSVQKGIFLEALTLAFERRQSQNSDWGD